MRHLGLTIVAAAACAAALAGCNKQPSSSQTPAATTEAPPAPASPVKVAPSILRIPGRRDPTGGAKARPSSGFRR